MSRLLSYQNVEIDRYLISPITALNLTGGAVRGPGDHDTVSSLAGNRSGRCLKLPFNNFNNNKDF